MKTDSSDRQGVDRCRALACETPPDLARMLYNVSCLSSSERLCDGQEFCCIWRTQAGQRVSKYLNYLPSIWLDVNILNLVKVMDYFY